MASLTLKSGLPVRVIIPPQARFDLPSHMLILMHIYLLTLVAR